MTSTITTTRRLRTRRGRRNRTTSLGFLYRWPRRRLIDERKFDERFFASVWRLRKDTQRRSGCHRKGAKCNGPNAIDFDATTATTATTNVSANRERWNIGAENRVLVRQMENVVMKRRPGRPRKLFPSIKKSNTQKKRKKSSKDDEDGEVLVETREETFRRIWTFNFWHRGTAYLR